VYVDVLVAGELIDERDRDFAVVQSRDRLRELVARIEPAKLDLAADLIAGRIVFADDGRAVRLWPGSSRSDDDVTAIVQETTWPSSWLGGRRTWAGWCAVFAVDHGLEAGGRGHNALHRARAGGGNDRRGRRWAIAAHRGTFAKASPPFIIG
jgi:hypothetical protein